MPNDCNSFSTAFSETEAVYDNFQTAIQDLEEFFEFEASDSGLQDKIQIPSLGAPVDFSFPPSDAVFWGLNHRDVGLRQTFADGFVDTSKTQVAAMRQSLLAEPVADPSAPLREPLPWRGVGAREAC
mmetsp:Transcript_41039/g.118584  ORF Transcript_41039/g.118584 Transcript_41039/m.118584 type:complete len:127 (+) Transcript_41039:179-559(+)